MRSSSRRQARTEPGGTVSINLVSINTGPTRHRTKPTQDPIDTGPNRRSARSMILDATPVRVGRTELFAPRVGLGTAVLGNFQQAISDADAIAVIDRALAS